MFDVTVNPEFEAPSRNISGNFLPRRSEKTCLHLCPAPAWGCTELMQPAVTRCERDFTAKFQQKQSCVRYTCGNTSELCRKTLRSSKKSAGCSSDKQGLFGEYYHWEFSAIKSEISRSCFCSSVSGSV